MFSTRTKATLVLSLGVLAPALASCGGSDQTNAKSAPPGLEEPAPPQAKVAPDDAASAAQRGLERLESRAAAWVVRPFSFVDTPDHTCALSCHTTVAYVMAGGSGAALATIMGKVNTRVGAWADLPPYYDFAKEQSRSTEAVLSAVALLLSEKQAGRTTLSEMARAAVRNAFDRQESGGEFNWLQEDLAPFEDEQARYWGAALFALALGNGPGGYQAAIAAVPNGTTKLQKLKNYLIDGFDAANVHARIMAARANAVVPGIVPATKLETLKNDVLTRQKADGSWALASLGSWSTREGEEIDAETAVGDGLGTALGVLLLLDTGMPATSSKIQRAKTWLIANQAASGEWTMKSLNRPNSDFNNGIISDASTGYAVMALKRLQ